MKIVDFSLRKRITISMVVMVIVILGFISYTRLGLDMFPDVELPYVSIVTTYPGVAAEDIEETVTRPLEQWVSTVTNVKEVKSISQEGVSILMVEFESGTNLDFAAQDIRDTIGLYEVFLPDNVSDPMVMKFDVTDMPIMMYGITGGNRPLKELKEYIDNEVATRLERLDGVASAMIWSPEEAEVLVNIDKGKMESRGLSITQVERAIQASNVNLPSGYLEEKHKEYLIRTIGEFRTVEEINDVMVGFGRTGEPIFLRDIAETREANKEQRSLARMNGTKGIMMVVTKSSGANTVLVARGVKKALEKILPTLDPDLNFTIAMDFSRIIEIMTVNNTRNILIGGILAMLLIFLFLRNIRPTLAIGIAIPLSIISTFIALEVGNFTLNLITLAGLALGVGMLVDNAIVVIESIYRNLEEGKTSLEAARIGTSEVGTAIIASTMTTIAVFFPMVFASGIAGDLSRDMALTVAFALLSSLFVALTIIPMLASWLFKIKKNSKKSSLSLGVEKFDKFRNFYEKFLHRALKKRKLVMLTVIGLFILSLVVAFFLGAEFMPPVDRSMIVLKLTMPVGTNIAETNRIIKYLEEQSLKDKNSLSTMVQVGLSEQNASDSASGFAPAGSYEAILWAYLVTSSKRDISDKQILESWRQHFPDLKEGKVQFIDIASAMMGGSGTSPIEFSFYGRDLDTLEMIASKVKAKISGIKGIRDVELSLQKRKPEILLKIKKEEASKLGLTPYDISRQVQTFTIGTVVSRMILQGEDRDIRVRLEERDRDNVEALKKLPVMTPSGNKVYLSQLVEFQPTLGAVKIDRENQVRKVSVNANFVDRNLSDIVKEIMDKSRSIIDNLPEGYFYEMGGQYQDMIESFKTMFLALLLSVVLVYAVMASQFENLKYPFIIMFTMPLAFIGVVVLMALTGNTISLSSVMGFVILGGIVVNNGIVMVDYINQLIARGIEKYDAVVRGAVVRLRPILITSLTTIFGMLPLAFSSKEGAETSSPLAIALIGGLFASTFLTLFIVPILYTYFSKIKVKD